jgi:lipopolysaccharide assembly LptE-like protein
MKARLGLAVAALLTGACGYALVGRGTVVDPDIKKIGVPQFVNSSGRPELDMKVTRSVIEELLKRGRFDVVPDATGVNALVQGDILSYRAQPVGFAGSEEAVARGVTAAQASRYEIVLTAKIKYTKTGVDEPIWSNDSFTFKEEYDLGSDPAAFVDRESQAIDRLVDSFARTLVANMLEAF